MTKKYVLTGAPGCGKTSVLLGLEYAGETIVRESAEDYIRLRQSLGNRTPWKEEDFQENIFKLQQLREASIGDHRRVFLDRGMIDILVYSHRLEPHYQSLRTTCQNERYDEVFFLMPQDNKSYKNTVRREDPVLAEQVGIDMIKTWRKYGYNPIIIPRGSVNERMKRILAYTNGTVEDLL